MDEDTKPPDNFNSINKEEKQNVQIKVEMNDEEIVQKEYEDEEIILSCVQVKIEDSEESQPHLCVVKNEDGSLDVPGSRMENLPYAVVKFPLENSVGVVCSKWIATDGKEAYYPAKRKELINMKYILRNQTEVMSGWKIYPIIILGKYATFAEARYNEKKAEDKSNLSSDDEDTEENKKRMRVPPSKYDGSSENESSPPPIKKKKILQHHSTKSLTCSQMGASQISSSHSPLSFLEKNTNQSLTTPYNCTNFQTVTLQSPHRACFNPGCTQNADVMDKLNHILLTLNALVQQVQVLSDNRSVLVDSQDVIFQMLPIKTMEEFDIVEQKLEETVFKNSFVKAMSTLGGRDPTMFLLNILKTTLTDEAAEQFSLTGKKMGPFPAKRRFLDTKLCYSIFDTVRRSHREVTNDDLRNTLKGFLQQAAPRVQKKEKRLTESSGCS